MNTASSIPCWKQIGIHGDRSCRELAVHIHCRNCPRYEAGGQALFDQPPPPGYQAEWRAWLAQPVAAVRREEKAAQVFRVDQEWLALAANLFVEVVDPRPIRRIPHNTQPILLGLISVRGQLHLSFSMERLLGIGPSPAEEIAGLRALPRFCVVRRNDATWAFPADEVTGVHRFMTADIQPCPATVNRAIPKFSLGLLTRNERSIGLLDEDLLFSALERVLPS